MVSISTEGQYHNSSLSKLTLHSIEGKVGRKRNLPLVMISASRGQQAVEGGNFTLL